MIHRRGFLSWASSTGLGLCTPWIASCGPEGAAPGTPPPVPCMVEPDDGKIFDLSVASGDPSATGVILWTHLRADAVVAGRPLAFQLARDPAFTALVLEGEVPASAIGSARDYTVSVDLDGRLAPGNAYYYRFVYGCRASRTGRCRTLPPAGVASVKLALVTCQDYTNGYYGTFRAVADDDSDFLLHLGDFIYESAADPRFQPLPFADRAVILPSGGAVAMGLADYRSLYRTYRSDPALQRALERHTLIAIPDDHETANDCYWDYPRDTLGAPDHPLRDAGALRQLKLDSQRAWAEYVPARVTVDLAATHPHRFLRTYRDFAFGDLLRYVALDTRTYRTPHPCGEGDVFQRYLPVACSRASDMRQSLLGAEQRPWLIDRLSADGALWKVLGNQTFFGRLTIGAGLPVNVDAWDGYEAERRWLAEEVRARGVKNFVIVTGDLHSYLASTVKVDYAGPNDASNIIGAEFMTPSVTSAALFDLILKSLGNSPLASGLTEGAVRLNNPHLRYFNSSQHGYSTLELTREHCEWVAYAVDKDHPDAPRKAITRFRKTIASPTLTELPV